MPTVFPYIPETITVHLGAPNEPAENVTVSFPNYVKNVVSSEIFPTWEPAALRANTLAIISFALNRVYTEYYRSRGYPFEITASTSIDQKFINGRNIYQNISEIVDMNFNDYLRRMGNLEPLAAKFCNGVSVNCDGLSQWGSQYLAQEGESSLEILQTYYGNDIEVVTNAPIRGLTETYPGSPLRAGDIGVNVAFIQTELNRVSQDYPAIPKLTVDAIYGPETEQAVREFQRAFSLAEDGVVGRQTWYMLLLVYTSVSRLGELRSEGFRFQNFSWEYPESIAPGEVGAKVTHLQYMLRMIAEFNNTVPAPPLTGRYGEETEQSVRAFQTDYGLTPTGSVDRDTWDLIYAQFSAIDDSALGRELFPFLRSELDASAASLREQLTQAAKLFPGMRAPADGSEDALRRSVAAFQQLAGLPQTGRADDGTRALLAQAADSLRYQDSARFRQYPGHVLTRGQTDAGEVRV